MMKIFDEIELKIEKLSNLGLGIAKHDGLVIFVENSCPEDKIIAKITKINKNFAFAQIVEILEPSKHRIKPVCAMQNTCGGCQIQFIDYDYQLDLKREIVSDALKTIGNLDVNVERPIPSPNAFNYRHKVQYPVAQTKVSKRILAGYYKPKSHELVNIKFCPIQPEICDKIIDFIRNNANEFGISGYNEKKHSGDLRHVVLRVSDFEKKVLVTLVINSTKSFDNLRKFSDNLYNCFPEISGVCINFNPQKTNVILGDNSELIAGQDFVTEKILDYTFKIGPKTFFQVNPKSAENIFKFVKDYICANFDMPVVLDAYAGVSAFGITLSSVCEKVVCVEENAEASALAQETVLINKINNVEIHNADVQRFFATEMELNNNSFDIVILDPPRKGCSEECLNNVLKTAKNKIIYVSCNPATLARDLKYLAANGAKVELVQPFDMFCHTYHIETVAVINII